MLNRCLYGLGLLAILGDPGFPEMCHSTVKMLTTQRIDPMPMQDLPDILLGRVDKL
jgi:hypothetical protein